MSYNDEERRRIEESDRRWMEDKKRRRLEEVGDLDYQPPTNQAAHSLKRSYKDIESDIESEFSYNYEIIRAARKKEDLK